VGVTRCTVLLPAGFGALELSSEELPHKFVAFDAEVAGHIGENGTERSNPERIVPWDRHMVL